MASENGDKETGMARGERQWAEKSAMRPGHFNAHLFPLGNLSLFLDQIAACIAGDRERHLEQQRGRALTEAERIDIARDIDQRVLDGQKRIQALVVENATDPFQNRPLNRHRFAEILRLAAGLLTIGGGRPATVDIEMVYINFRDAREQLAPLWRKLRTVKNPDTAWRWLQGHDSALAAEVLERGFKKTWFAARPRPTLDSMAAALISDHHPGVSLNTLIRYGRRKVLK